MRRTFASLLVLLFSFPLIAPLLAANLAQDVPACCRRDGKHHCAMSEGQTAPTQGPAFGAQCPFYRQGQYTSGSSSATVFPPATGPRGMLLTAGAIPHAATFIHDSQSADSAQKRGPPSFE